MAPGAVEVFREPSDPGEHLERREVHVRSLARPVVDDPVDFVGGGHLSILARAAASAARPFRGTSAVAPLHWYPGWPRRPVRNQPLWQT